MTRRTRVLLYAAGAVVLVGVLWWATWAWVQSPAAAVQSRIDGASASLDGRRRDLDRASTVTEGIEAIASEALGSTVEAMDLAIRSRLGALAELAGVTEVRVSTSSPVFEATPGKRAFKSRSLRELRDEPDFLLVPASITARGTWAQVSLLIESIQAEPWPHRISRVRLAQRDAGATIEATVHLEALFVPGSGRHPEAQNAPPLASVETLTVSNPFAMPAKPSPPLPAQVPSPTVTAGASWRVVHIGRVEGEGEVLVQSTKGKRMRMVIGDVVGGITLVFIEADRDGIDVATFGHNGATWVVEAGQSLRQP
jgi:hypothetical protein